MWMMKKDNVFKIVHDKVRRAELEELGFTVVLNEPETVREETPVKEHAPVKAPEVRDTSEKNGHNPLMWNGKYLTQLASAQELRDCLRELGVDVKKNDTRAVLKAKLDGYIKTVKTGRR